MARRTVVSATDEDYEKAIKLLEDGGTKKAACSVLGIAYNTTRLDRLIVEWLERQERNKQMRAKKRKTAVEEDEVVTMIEMYLSGSSLTDISASTFRSVQVIKHHLEKNGALLKAQGTVNKSAPPLVPPQCVSDTFEKGEYVWSMMYDCLAKVQGEYKGAIRIVTMGGEAHRFQSYQAPYELASLKHLEALGVNMDRIRPTMLEPAEQIHMINTAIKNANKKGKK